MPHTRRSQSPSGWAQLGGEPTFDRARMNGKVAPPRGQYTAHLKERAMRWRRAKAECRIHGEGGDGHRFLAPSNGA
jgi:hypothetical protein